MKQEVCSLVCSRHPLEHYWNLRDQNIWNAHRYINLIIHDLYFIHAPRKRCVLCNFTEKWIRKTGINFFREQVKFSRITRAVLFINIVVTCIWLSKSQYFPWLKIKDKALYLFIHLMFSGQSLAWNHLQEFSSLQHYIWMFDSYKFYLFTS